MHAASSSTTPPGFQPLGPAGAGAKFSDLPSELILEIINKLSQSDISAALRNLAAVSSGMREYSIYTRKAIENKELQALTANPSKFLDFIKKLAVDSIDLLPKMSLLFSFTGAKPPENSQSTNLMIHPRGGVILAKKENQCLKTINDLLFPQVNNIGLLTPLLPNQLASRINEFMEIHQVSFPSECKHSYSKQGMRTAAACEFERFIKSQIERGYEITYEDIDSLLMGGQTAALQEIRGSDRGVLLNNLEWCAICGTPEELDQYNLTNINQLGASNRTPLHYAALKGDVKMVEALMQRGAINIASTISLPFLGAPVSQFYITPLSLAIVRGHNDCARALLGEVNNIFSVNNTLDLNKRDLSRGFGGFSTKTDDSKQFSIPIILALINNNIEFLTYILESENFTPTSVQFGNIIKVLITFNTPKDGFERVIQAGLRFIEDPLLILAYAVKLNSTEIARLMLERGAAPNQLFIEPLDAESKTFNEIGEIAFPKVSTALTDAHSNEMLTLLKNYGGVRYVDVAVKVSIIVFTAFLAVASAMPAESERSQSFSASEIKGIFSTSILAWLFLNMALSHALRTKASIRRSLGDIHTTLLGCVPNLQ